MCIMYTSRHAISRGNELVGSRVRGKFDTFAESRCRARKQKKGKVMEKTGSMGAQGTCGDTLCP